MTEEIEQPELDTEDPVEIEDTAPAPARTVPLESLQAERRKRQEAEAKYSALQDVMKSPAKQMESETSDEDDDEFITKAEMKDRLNKLSFNQKREVLEEAFCDSKPEAVEMINQHLQDIIKRKPWLAQTIESAPNRYARAYEIVQDYAPKENAPSSKFSRPKDEARKIVENAQKPGNPATISKAANGTSLEYLKSIQGKPEFREYRKKIMAGG